MPPDAVRRFEAQELRRFLAAVDAHLDGPARMILVGGSAMALGYGVAAGTRDVDTWETDLRRLDGVFAEARTETGLNIPVEPAAVGDVPWEFESRLQRVLPELPRLQVFVLEKHDLALSKALRCNEGDLVAIEQLHHLRALDRGTLIARYLDEMGHAIGDRARLDQNIVLVVLRLFGELDAALTDREIKAHRRDG